MTAITLVFFISTALLGSVNARFPDTGSMKNDLMGADDTALGDTCQDCTQIMVLLKDLISNEDFQAKLITTLETLCDKLPGPAAGICHKEVEKTLPLAISFISNMMKPKEICTYLGLCGGHNSGMMKELLLNHISKTVTMPTMQPKASIQCAICTYILSTLEYLFPKESIQSAITDLLENFCNDAPIGLQTSCKRMVERYVQMFIDMLLNSSSPNFICTILRFCQKLDGPIKEGPALSDCDSCLTLMVLSRMNLGSNATEHEIASFLDSVCQLHPSAMPKCETYIQWYGEQLHVFLGKEQEALSTCQRANLCLAGEKQHVNATDPIY